MSVYAHKRLWLLATVASWRETQSAGADEKRVTNHKSGSSEKSSWILMLGFTAPFKQIAQRVLKQWSKMDWNGFKLCSSHLEMSLTAGASCGSAQLALTMWVNKILTSSNPWSSSILFANLVTWESEGRLAGGCSTLMNAVPVSKPKPHSSPEFRG